MEVEFALLSLLINSLFSQQDIGQKTGSDTDQNQDQKDKPGGPRNHGEHDESLVTTGGNHGRDHCPQRNNPM